MKKISTLFFGMSLLLSGVAFSQSDLYIGYRGNGTTSGQQLSRLDTTDFATGGMTLAATLEITTDFEDDVDGIYGMALHPFTNEVYCVYGLPSGNPEDRRLGTIDLSTAEISDIAAVGSVIDITFVDTTLYGSTGNMESERFVRINTATGENTVLFEHTNGGGGSAAINFDYANRRIIRSVQGFSQYTIIDPNSLTESSLPAASHPGWTTSLLTLNDELALSVGNNLIKLLNTTTFTFSNIYTFPSGNYTHSSIFGSYPLSLWVNGNRNMCTGDESILTVVGDGTDFEWYKDGVLIPGAESSTYTVTEAGLYTVIVDEKELNPVNITYTDVYDPSFTISENPAFLEGEATVTVGFVASEIDPSITYDWDSGNGEVSDVANPLFTYDAIGTYDVTLTVTNASGACPQTTTQVLEVAGGVGLTELERNIEIYPNPVVNTLSIQLDDVNEYSIEILDINGAVVLTMNNSDNEITQVDVSTLTSGTYICKVITENHVIEKSFVKQ